MHSRVVALLVAWAGVLSGVDHGYGPLPRKPLPAVKVTDQDGRQVFLPEIVRGRAVAVQFIFSSCATACPLLGSLFSTVQKRLEKADGQWMLLSVSVDPERDGPADLKRWLRRQHAGTRWYAVTADKEATSQILAAFGQKAGPIADHSAQVFFVNKNGEVVSRTTPLPDAVEVAAELRNRSQ